MKIIFATQNQGKLIEMRGLLFGHEVLSAVEAGVSEDVLEDGDSLEANAFKKASYVTEKTGEWSVADDSGIFIEALGKRPGIHTARWAVGTGRNLVEHTLFEMKDVPVGKRQAYFECVLVLMSPAGEHYVFNGRVDGDISLEPVGESLPKLSYDSIFVPKGFKDTLAQISLEEKNKLSHRGLAFKKLIEFLDNKDYGN